MFDSNDLVKDLEIKLSKVADERTKIWWENYVKHNAKFLGVSIPKIRKNLNQWYKEKNIAQLSLDKQLNIALSFFSKEYSECKFVGILILQNYIYDKINWKLLIIKFEELFEKDYICDWNICDWFCIRVLSPLIKKHSKPCAKEIFKWNRSENIWKARCSLVAFVGLVENKDYTPLILNSASILIKRNERFAKTAVGWALRELSKVNENVVIDFINKNKKFFSKESLRNAIKYLSKEQNLKLIVKV